MRKWHPSVAIIAVLVLGSAGLLGQQSPNIPALNELELLIKKLASASSVEREKATKELKDRLDAAPLLRAAVRSSDPEVSRRAANILATLAKRASLHHLAKAREYAVTGQVDLLFEHLAVLEKGDHEEDCWKIFGAFMRDIRKRAHQAKATVDLGFSPDLAWRHREILVAPSVHLKEGEKKTEDGDIIEEGDEKWVRARDFTGLGKIVACMILAERINIKDGNARGHMVGCFAYASQAVEVPEIAGSILICDGDVDVKNRSPGGAHMALIIARGKVRFDCGKGGGVGLSHIVAGDIVSFGGESRAGLSLVVEREKKPLGFLRFFEVSDVGLHVIENEKGMHVNTVDDKQPFGRAGVVVKDRILGVDGKEVRTYEAFRRIVRTKFVSREPFTLSIEGFDGTKRKAHVSWKPEP